MTEGPRHIGGDVDELFAAMQAARGGVRFAEPAGDQEHEAQRFASRRRDLMVNGIPAGAATVIAADALADTLALRKTREWFRNPERRQVLVLAGPKDACKTTAASCAVDAWPWRGLDQLPRLVAWENILGPWYHRPSEASPHDELTGLRRRDLLTTRLLVLDDVGQEPAELALRFGEALDLLLKTRCDAGAAIILTTNYEEPVDSCRTCRRPLAVCDATQPPDAGARGRDAARRERDADRRQELLAQHVITGLVTRYGPRGARIGERLTEFAEWVRCPVEGFRSKERREWVLKRRQAAASRSE